MPKAVCYIFNHGHAELNSETSSVFTFHVYNSSFGLQIILHYFSKKSTDGMSAQVFESDIIDTEKV